MKKLFGMERSNEALECLESELRRAEKAGDSLTVALMPLSDGESKDKLLDELDELVEKYKVDVDIENLSDHSGGSLIELSEKGEYDEIVLSGTQRSPMDKIRIDDTTEFVLLNSRITVKIIR